MIKKLIRGIGVMAIGLFLFPLSAFAADKSAVLSEIDSGVQAFVELPSEETIDPITSLQMEFQVEIIQGNAEQAKAEFHFNEAIKSSVKEYRYHADTGILAIYISGKHNLFSEKLLSEQKLDLGKLILFTEDELGVKAKISVIKDSYRFVSGNGTKTETESINTPGFTEITIGNGGVEPTPPTPEEEEEQPTPPTPEEEEEQPTPPTPEEEEEQPTPPTPEEEEEQPTPPTSEQNTSVGTGDTTHPMRYAVTAVLAAIALIFLGIFEMKKRKDSEKF